MILNFSGLSVKRLRFHKKKYVLYFVTPGLLIEPACNGLCDVSFALCLDDLIYFYGPGSI